MVMILRDRHTKRLKSGACSVGSGLVFMETLTYLERASDQCSSIAVMMLARNNENILQTITIISGRFTRATTPPTVRKRNAAASSISSL